MQRTKAYVSNGFLNDFEKEYINLKSSFDFLNQKLEKFDSLYLFLVKSSIHSEINEGDLKNYLMTNNNPVIKSLLKNRTDIKIEKDLFNELTKGNSEEFINSLASRSIIEIFCLNKELSNKKLKTLSSQYGTHFLNVDIIENLKIREDFQVGNRQLDIERVFNSFKPFNTLIIIDPYLLDKMDSQNKLVNLLRNIMPQSPKSKVYLDLITKNIENYAVREKFLANLKEIEADFNVQIRYKIHEISSEYLHDRNYLSNNYIINFGHGLEAFKDKKDSDIRIETIFSKSDNSDFVKKITDKLFYYKNKIKTGLGENPLWKIVQ